MNPNELKSAEEWLQDETIIGSTWIMFIKQIQLNAYKAGMTEAVEIVVTCPELRFGDIKQAILAARDKKESL